MKALPGGREDSDILYFIFILQSLVCGDVDAEMFHCVSIFFFVLEISVFVASCVG